jgi:hypothetical protein
VEEAAATRGMKRTLAGKSPTETKATTLQHRRTPTKRIKARKPSSRPTIATRAAITVVLVPGPSDLPS